MHRADAIVAELRAMGSERDRAGMARFGIAVERAFGVNVARLRAIAKREGREHALARALWATGWHEARILAALVEDPSKVTPAQMERWAKGFDSWDLCDQVVAVAFEPSPHALAKARAWARRDEEFVKRAAFVIMARRVVRAKDAPDREIRPFLAQIRRGASDGRNYVKKAASWALREIGKRRSGLRAEAIALAEELAASEDPARRWVGRDALRDITRSRGRAPSRARRARAARRD